MATPGELPLRLSAGLRRLRLRARDALRPLLPARARLILRRADRALDPLMIAAYRLRTGERRPIPPRRLRERNAVDYVSGWFPAVAEAAEPLHRILAHAGTRIEDFERVLDFGCGAGKVIVSLRGRGPELHGCDLHEPSIAWLAGQYPDLHVHANAQDPPLSYPDEHFDLIFAWSVLTHMDAELQLRWLAEWRRILRPGGLVLATFLAPDLAEERTHRWLAAGGVQATTVQRLARHGVAFQPASTEGNFATEFTGTTGRYGDTLNTHEYVRETWGEVLDVVDVLPRAVWRQACAIMRRPG